MLALIAGAWGAAYAVLRGIILGPLGILNGVGVGARAYVASWGSGAGAVSPACRIA